TPKAAIHCCPPRPRLYLPLGWGCKLTMVLHHAIATAHRGEPRALGPPDVGSKKRSVLGNLLSQPARSASNQGELHAIFLTQTCARCNGFARNRRAVTSRKSSHIPPRGPKQA